MMFHTQRVGKSGGIPHDEIEIDFLKAPKEANFAFKLALKEFKKDRDANPLLVTLRLVVQAQGGLMNVALNSAISRKTLRSVLEALGIKFGAQRQPE